MTAKNIAKVLLLGATLTGCVTTSDLPFIGAYDTSDKEGRFVELYQFSDLTYTFDEEKIETDRRVMIRDSKGLIPDDNLAEYAQSILDRIVQTGPNTPLKPKVHIIASVAPGAYTMPSGDIFIHHSIFDYSDNEDQIAFILAHEYSHALIQHNRSDIIDKLRPYIVTALDIAVSQTDSDDQTKKALKVYGTDLITRDLLMPVWERKKEDEADRLGIDLMVAAGYNPNESIKALSHVKAYDDTFEAIHPVERNALEKALLKNDTSDAEIKKFNLGSLTAKFLVEFQNAFGNRHPDPQERMKKVFLYIEREYEDAGYRELSHLDFNRAVFQSEEILNKYKKSHDLELILVNEENISTAKFAEITSSARWTVTGSTVDHAYTRQAFAKLRARQGRFDLALQNLDLTSNDDGFLPGLMEKNRIDWLERTGEAEKAYARVKEVGNYYEWPLRFYPDAIRLGQRVGTKKEVSAYKLECTLKYPQSRDLCQ